MADIAKCTGKTKQGSVCDNRNNCYRYTASEGTWQSYIEAPFIITDNGVYCEFYWFDTDTKKEEL